MEVFDKILKALMFAGLKINNEKIQFYTKSAVYLGYVFDENGVHPSSEKIRAVLDAPAPTNVKELQSFIGLCNFYRSL